MQKLCQTDLYEWFLENKRDFPWRVNPTPYTAFISDKERDELSFGEKARELGAHLAHQAYDEVTELVQVVPQPCGEVREIGSKFLPESLSPSNNDGSSVSPMENHSVFTKAGRGLTKHEIGGRIEEELRKICKIHKKWRE